MIDEYPYLAQAGTPRKRVATMLQNALKRIAAWDVLPDFVSLNVHEEGR